MRKLLLIFALVLLGFQAEAQSGMFSARIPGDNAQKKYFIAAGYGWGNAYWNSKLVQSGLYDHFGGPIQLGDLKYKLKTQTVTRSVEVAFPVEKIRMGVGLCMEDYFIENLNLNGVSIEFKETFRMQKIYAHLEIPIAPKSTGNFGFNIKSQAGYYGATGVTHSDFMGSDNKASTFFLTTGFLMDYRCFPHSYIFVHGNIGYNYFNNAASENPSNIIHNIFNPAISIGIRVDVSEE